MKKIFSIAIAALALTACAEMYGPKQDSVPALEGQDIDITVKDVKDSSFTVVLAPKGEAAYYSYLVDESSEVEEVDPNDIYEVLYEGVAQGTVKYSKEKPSFTLQLKDLTPDTDYVIYAVAASVDGTVTKVATATAHTTDAGIPEIDDFEVDGNVAYILFADGDITYNEEMPITVRVYHDENISDDIYEDVEAATVDPESISVEVLGNVAKIEIEGLHAGAYFSVSYEEGTFTDATGNECPALESGFYWDEDEEELASEGICGRIDNEEFDLTFYNATEENDGNPDLVTNLIDAIWLNVPEGFELGDTDASKLATVFYDNGTERHEYDLPEGFNGGMLFGWSIYKCPVIYPWGGTYAVIPEPARGSMVTITIPAGWLIDVWGNKNNELTIGPFLYSYGYTEDDVFGTYDLVYSSYFGGSYTGQFILGEADYEWDEEEEGEPDPEYNIAILAGSDFGGLQFAYDVYGWVDYDRGTITFPKGQTIYIGLEDYDEDGEDDCYGAYVLIDYNNDESINFTVPTAGSLVLDSSAWLGAYIYFLDEDFSAFDGSFYDLATSAKFTKVADEETSGAKVSMSMPLKKFTHKNDGYTLRKISR